MAAINLVINASLFIPVEGEEEVVESTGDHFSILSSKEQIKDEILFVPERHYTSIFEVLRNKDPFSLPRVVIEFVYQNLMGACFAVQESYNIVASDDIESDLKAWHLAINSFAATHQEALTAMAERTSTIGTFGKIREEFVANVGMKEFLSLHLVVIPGTFNACAVSREYYDGFLIRVGLPRLTFPDTICPIVYERE